MTKQELMEKYPSWFARVKDNMVWGFGIREGWMPLFTELCEQIAACNPPADFQFRQIKEKLGLLTVYVNTRDEEINKLVDYFMEKSAMICERCASTENVDTKGRGYIVTLCENCRNAPLQSTS